MKIGPKYKIARRLGDRIFPKTQTSKFTVSGTELKTKNKSRRGSTEFGLQLIEKQKARYTYGISEKQFSNYVKKVHESKTDSPATSLFVALESRLDNVVFRLGLVNSRLFARQVVAHGHILVNGRKVTIPSYKVRVGDKIAVRPQSKDNGIFRGLAERNQNYNVPAWLTFDPEKLVGEVKAAPIASTSESNLNFGAILEFYSRV
jgi:small subunit ribosomal protein S4